jgi:peptidoglycan/LPS O-acetylase OafA/YrhL
MMDASAPPQPTSVRPRISQLDGLRFFAFFAVFLNHFTSLPMLWTGVDVFFVISGFLITGNLIELRERTADRRDFFATFYWRRFLRIFPPYYLVLFVIMAFRPQSRPDLPYYALFVSNFRDSLHVGGDGPLGVFWSLAVEEQF